MENGEEAWAVPTAGNRQRARNKINRLAPISGSTKKDNYINRLRPHRRNSVDYRIVREAMKAINVELFTNETVARKSIILSDGYRAAKALCDEWARDA